MKRKAILMGVLIALMAAATYAQTESDFQVTRANNAATITGYTGSARDVVIPARIQNTPVTAIGSEAFGYNTSITSVTIPDSVTTIGDYAFAESNMITSVTIGRGVTRIGAEAFVGCNSLKSVTFQGTIPTANFPANAFSAINLGDLRAKYIATGGGAGTYTRPDAASRTWTKQGTAAPAATVSESDFRVTRSGNAITITGYTGRATIVNIPSTIQGVPVTAIGMNAFSGTNIQGITIPASVTSIENMAFASTGLLRSVTFSGTIPSSGFSPTAFPDKDLRAKFYAAPATASGRPGTYQSETGSVWAIR